MFSWTHTHTAAHAWASLSLHLFFVLALSVWLFHSLFLSSPSCSRSRSGYCTFASVFLQATCWAAARTGLQTETCKPSAESLTLPSAHHLEAQCSYCPNKLRAALRWCPSPSSSLFMLKPRNSSGSCRKATSQQIRRSAKLRKLWQLHKS